MKLKRKESYKSHHLHKTINPEKVVKATQYFNAIGHPLYQNIDIDTNYNPEFPSDQNESALEDETNSDVPEIPDTSENLVKSDINSDNDFITSFDKNCSVVDEYDDRLDAGRREGKIPSSLMRDDSWDISGFPNLHPLAQWGYRLL